MSIRNSAAALLCAGCALQLAACAHVTPEQRSFFDQQGQRVAGRGASLIGDGCVVRDEIGDDYILRHASLEVGQQVARSSAKYLATRGMPVRRMIVPLLCGGSTAGRDELLIADDKNTPASRAVLPLPSGEAVGDLDAYDALLRAVEAAPYDQSPVALAGLNPTQLASLRSGLDADYAWIVRAGGVQVSAGKSIGVALLSAAITGGISGGAVIGYTMPVDGHGQGVALVDLASATLLWRKQEKNQGGNPADVEKLNEDWARDSFDPFLSDDDDAAVVAGGATSPARAAAR